MKRLPRRIFTAEFTCSARHPGRSEPHPTAAQTARHPLHAQEDIQSHDRFAAHAGSGMQTSMSRKGNGWERAAYPWGAMRRWKVSSVR